MRRLTNCPRMMVRSWYRYGTQLIIDNKERGADLILQSIESRYRLQDAQYYSSISDFYYYSDDLEGAEKLLLEAKNLDPGNSEYFHFPRLQLLAKEGV